MSNPAAFQATIDAVQSGYTWSDILRAWVKFLPRTGDGYHTNHGYDVEVTLAPRTHPLFQNQYKAVPFDTVSLDRVVLASDLAALPTGQQVKLVLDAQGKVVEGATHQRRMVGV